MCFLILNCYSRTTDTHTLLTSNTFVLINTYRWLMNCAFYHNTRSAAYDNRWLLNCKLLCYSFFHSLKIIWINHSYPVKAKCLAQCFKVNLTCRLTSKILTSCRILLMASHTCYGIIQNNNSRVTHIVRNISYAGHTRMYKC